MKTRSKKSTTKPATTATPSRPKPPERPPPPPKPGPVKPNKNRPAWAAYWPLGCPLPGTEAYDALPWPEACPVLVADDLTRQHVIPLEEPPYNLDGWLEATFGEDGPVAALARLALDGVVGRRLGRQASSWEYLLEKGVKRKDAAAAWKEAMELLGYDTDRPAPSKPKNPAPEYDEYFT